MGSFTPSHICFPGIPAHSWMLHSEEMQPGLGQNHRDFSRSHPTAGLSPPRDGGQREWPGSGAFPWGQLAGRGPVPMGRAAHSSVSADIWGWEPPVTCHSSASPGQVACTALIPGTARIPPDKPSDPRLLGSRRRLRGLRRAGDACGSSLRGDETWSVSGWWE